MLLYCEFALDRKATSLKKWCYHLHQTTDLKSPVDFLFSKRLPILSKEWCIDLHQRLKRLFLDSVNHWRANLSLPNESRMSKLLN